MLCRRYEGNPILTPTDNWWETKAVFNGAAVQHEGRIIMLYRAVGDDNTSRFGLAISEDGFKFRRFRLPVFEGEHGNEFERLGVEDPRITRINDTFYITYVSASTYPAAEDRPPTFGFGPPWRCRVSLASTKDFRTFQRHGILLPEFDDKDAVLFPEKINGRWVLYHRILPDMWISYSDDMINWTGHRAFMTPRHGLWDDNRIGAGAPPIKTRSGWLNFYHAADHNRVYRIGAFLSDLHDPSIVISRPEEPILTPQDIFECEGCVSNVVFTCGVIEREDDFIIYYGGADSSIGAAVLDKSQLSDFLGMPI